MRDGKRHIYIGELIRVFGEPKKQQETDTADGTAATAAGEVSGGAEVVALLREQLTAADERTKRAEALADAERERADRYERERDEFRDRNEELITRLLPPPAATKRPGWLARVFGG